MLSLPILSPKQKNIVRIEFCKRLVLAYFFDLMCVCVVFMLIMLGVKTVLIAKTNLVKKDSGFKAAAQLESEIKDYENEIKDVNQMLFSFNLMSQNYLDVSDVLYRFTMNLPDDISLYSLQFGKEKNELKVQGRSPLRENILVLQSDLEKDVYFSNIDFPLSNFTQKIDVDFYFSAQINNE